MSDNLNYDAAGANTYQRYTQDHRFEYDNGLIVWPVAGRTPAFRVIRLHGGVGVRRVEWEASRRGKPPIVPSMTDTDYDTFLGGSITAALPQPDPQSIGYSWHVSGSYLYVQTQPRIVGTNSIPTGGFPYPVVPNDALGNQLVADQVGNVLTNATPTDNVADLIGQAVGEDTVDHEEDNYLWPLTVLPPVFTNDNIIGA